MFRAAVQRPSQVEAAELLRKKPYAAQDPLRLVLIATGVCHHQKFSLHLVMLNFILICLYALSGACAGIDVDTLNTLQSHVTFSVAKSAHATSILTMQSLARPSASIEITGQDNEDHTHSIDVRLSGFLVPSAQAKVQFTPAEEGYVCEVSVHCLNSMHLLTQGVLQELKKFTLHTKSAKFSVLSPTAKPVNNKLAVLEYSFPPCVDGINYSVRLYTDFLTFPKFNFFGKKACCEEYDDSAFTIIQA